MKSIRFFMLLGMAFVMSSLDNMCNAQDIEGFELGGKYTKEQIIQKFGQPQKYEFQPDQGEGSTAIFYYSDLNITQDSEIGLSSFYIESNKYRAMTLKIEGGIRVGDSFGKMSKYTPYRVRHKEGGDGANYSYYFDDDRLVLTIHVKDNVIVSIGGNNQYD